MLAEGSLVETLKVSTYLIGRESGASCLAKFLQFMVTNASVAPAVAAPTSRKSKLSKVELEKILNAHQLLQSLQNSSTLFFRL